MRSAILLALLAPGAAPAPTPSQALECRLPYADAVAALSHVPVQSREDLPGEDEYRHTRNFHPVRLAAFGFPVRAANAMKVDAISHETLVVTTTLNAPYAPIRTAALASRGRSECASADGPPGTCMIEDREQDGWTVDFLLGELNGHPTLTCLYTRPSS